MFGIYKILIVILLSSSIVNAQDPVFTREDTLRGSLTPERSWWNLNHYDLYFDVQPAAQFLSGKNTIHYKVERAYQIMQIDLQAPMSITKVTQDGKELKIKSEGSAHFIHLRKIQKVGAENSLTIYFSGKPHVSTNPPWNGGMVWSKDQNGKDFIATACQGIGASIWWPCKDHPADEPEEGVDISIAIPSDLSLTAVSNGRLINTIQKGNQTVFEWKVTQPINSYAVNMNIGDYAHFSEKFPGEKGTLDCDYYVLKDNLQAAKGQFQQVPKMLKAFEYWLGPYPFYEDGYKLVEVPYLGMEHQSSVTYGNGYKNGYKQTDLSHSGWGLNFDFIIVHESGHEWFANNITSKDVADLWVHESFTSYAENLYLDYYYGSKAGADYVIGTRDNIKNDIPITGIYGVNNEGSGDMYYKGANVLHTFRQWLNDDEQWRMILRKMNTQFYHETVSGYQIEEFLVKATGLNLKPFFDQYLRTTNIPVLEYKIHEGTLNYRWNNVVVDFSMPVAIFLDGAIAKLLTPTTDWQGVAVPSGTKTMNVDRNYYVSVSKVN